MIMGVSVSFVSQLPCWIFSLLSTLLFIQIFFSLLFWNAKLEREIDLVSADFTTHMVTTAKERPGWSHYARTPLAGSYTWVQFCHHLLLCYYLGAGLKAEHLGLESASQWVLNPLHHSASSLTHLKKLCKFIGEI